MLKRSKELARAVAESAGIVAPRMSDASKAAEEHRQSLVVAQAALESAEVALQAAHDRNAEDGELTRLEAAQAAAKAELSRAEARYIGAEKRLTAAREAEQVQAKAAAIEKRDAALAIRAKAAAEIDRLAAEIAAQVSIIDAQSGPLAEAAAAGVASRSTRAGAVLAQHSLEKAGALPSRWLGGRAEQPTASELAARDAGAVLAGT